MANQHLMADGMPDSMVETKVKLRSKLGIMETSPSDSSLSLEGPGERSARMNKKNITGMGIGEKVSGGAMSGEMAIRVYVRQKADMSDIDDRFRVPPEIDGFKTDVIVQDDMFAHAVHTGREEFPIPCGSSIGSSRTTGTLGALVQMQTGHLAMLSNNHVIATSNDGMIGDNIFQPGSGDGGGEFNDDRVGTLLGFAPLLFDGRANAVDAAVALTNIKLISASHHSYSLNPEIVDPFFVRNVRKDGRTTGLTAGRIIGWSEDSVVNYKGGTASAFFTDQIRIQGFSGSFSKPGDSGSLIVEEGSNRPTALLFAGNGETTLATPIQTVMSALGIDRFVGENDTVFTR